jgi:hypothetical protein
MYIYVAQDWDGNIYVTDDRDALPPNVTDFQACFLPEKTRFSENEDRTLSVDIKDYSEIISL